MKRGKSKAASGDREMYLNSCITYAYLDSREAEYVDCIIIIDGHSIQVKMSFEYEELPFVWYGTSSGADHFELLCPELAGRATLHRFSRGRVLDGCWWEDGDHGFWRIELQK